MTTPAAPSSLVGSAGNAAADTSRLATADNMKAATQKFEAIFVGMMMKSMRATHLGEDVLGSKSLDQFRDMQDKQFADALAARMPLGLGKALGAFLTRNQPSLTAEQPSSSTQGEGSSGK